MGRVKDWLMDMEEDANSISKDEFIKKHGKSNEIIWNRLNLDYHRKYSNFYNIENEFSELKKQF